MNRLDCLREFYTLLYKLDLRVGGPRLLSECQGRLSWPQRGVYFFLEPGEVRTESGTGQRVVRVGTHAVASGTDSSLWSRLSSHRGGGHRASVFRKLVGGALIVRGGLHVPTWGKGQSASFGDPTVEKPLERIVTETLGQMSVLWLQVDDPPGPRSMRAHIERHSIALLSNVEQPSLDPATPAWLGNRCPHETVRRSGLWNVDHTGRAYHRSFLDDFHRLIGDAPDGLVRGRVSTRSLLVELRSGLRAGTVVRTLKQGKANHIHSSDNEEVRVETDSSATPQVVPWSWMGDALEVLCRDGELTADSIPRPGRYRSTFIMAAIAQHLGRWVEVSRGARVALRLRTLPSLSVPAVSLSTPTGVAPSPVSPDERIAVPLVLIPCCKTKKSTSARSHGVPPLPGITSLRVQLCNRLVGTTAALRSENQSGLLAVDAPLTTACELYDGRLYRQVSDVWGNAGVQILIVSAAYGLVLPGETLRMYDLRMDDVLADGTRLRDFWRGHLAPILREYVASSNVRFVWSLLPSAQITPYHQVFSDFWKDCSNGVISRRVVVQRGDGRSAGSGSGVKRGAWLSEVVRRDVGLLSLAELSDLTLSQEPDFLFRCCRA